MFCLYSKSCRYAICALAEISGAETGQNVRARDICRKARIPEAYARKIFQALVQSGFLKAVSGPGGGYSIKRDPKITTILDAIEAVDGRDNFDGCVMGLASCDDRNPCPLHGLWVNLKQQIIGALGSRTIAEVAVSTRAKASRRKVRV